MATSKTNLCSLSTSRDTSSFSESFCDICREPIKDCSDLHKTCTTTRSNRFDQPVQPQILIKAVGIDSFKLCTQHPNKQTEFYCEDHSQLLCSICLLKDHRTCTKVVEIDIAGKAFLKSQFTDNVKDTCGNIAKSTDSIITEIKEGRKCTSECLKGLKIEIETIRYKLLQVFDRQTDNILQSVSGDVLGNNNKCEEAIRNLRQIGETVVKTESLFKNAVDNKRPADVFRGLLSVLEQLNGFKREIDQIKQHCLRQTITFEKSELVHMLETDKDPLLFCNVESTPLEFPSISSDSLKKEFKSAVAVIPNNRDAKYNKEQSRMDGAAKSSTNQVVASTEFTFSSDADLEETVTDELTPIKKQSAYLDIEVSYCRSFDVELSDDESPWYGGIVCLSDDRLVLSDYYNSRLIMVRNNTNITENDLEYAPGHMAVFNKRYLAVCLMKTNTLLLMEIRENSLKEYRYLQTQYHPKCVQAIDDKRMLLSSKTGNGKWNLEIMSLNGQRWSSVDIDIKFSGIYEGYKLAIQQIPGQQDDFRIIQCCEETEKLRCFTRAGGPAIFEYDVENTTSVLTDKLGYIFITRYEGEVQVLSPDGMFVTSLHRHAMKRLKFAAFNESRDKLFITTYKDSKIHVLDVKREKRVSQVLYQRCEPLTKTKTGKYV